MADKSAIEWTDATWNPVTGCTEVSPGCDHCYAKTFAERWRGTPGHHFENGFDVTLRPERLEQPLRWTRPRRVFVNSMSDLFHDSVPDLFITQVFDVMEQARQHTFQLLTKRHARMRSFVRAREQRWVEYAEKFDHCPTEAMRNSPAAQGARKRAVTPPPNIWLGVSVEDQKWADIRIPALLDTPAAVRFLSCEPLLGTVDLRKNDDGLHNWLPDFGPAYDDGSGEPVCQAHGLSRCRQGCAFIDWVIAGGESGPGSRPMHPDWARSLRDQCAAAGVPFFFKQWGGWAPGDRNGWYSRSQWVEYPDGGPAEFMYAPKSKSLRELDGRTHDEYPEMSRG